MPSRGLISDLKERLDKRLHDLENSESTDQAPSAEQKQPTVEDQMKLLRTKFDALVKAENITWRPKASDASPHAAIFDLLTNPRRANPEDWVSDNAGLFSAEDKQQVNYVIQSMFDNIGIDIAVVTVDSFPEDFSSADAAATELFQHWRIGSLFAQKGVLFFLVKSTKSCSIILGPGIPDHLLPPAAIKQLSAFMHQTYLNIAEPMWAVSVVDVLLECEKLLEEETRASDIVSAPEPKARDAYTALTREGGPLAQLTLRHKLFLLLFALTLFAIGAYLFQIRMVKNRCEECVSSVKYSDQNLNYNEGELVEKSLGSVRHVDKICTNAKCEHVQRIRISQKGFGLCPNCQYSTIDLRKINGNLKQTQKCRHCLVTLELHKPS